VNGDRVVRLDERLERDLPVARDDADDVRGHDALLERPRREVPREVLEVLGQRRRGRVEVHEHEPAPRADLCLGQAEVGRIDVGEVPRAGHLAEGPVEVPGEAVERAPEPGHLPGSRAQLRTAVQAGVVEGPDLVRRRPHDDQRRVHDLVDDRVADLGELLLAARHLPDAAPHPLDLEPVEIAVEVPLAGDLEPVCPAGGRRAQALGNGTRVLVEQ
jgi:hypothetical protein